MNGRITVLGLGPGDPSQRTIQCVEALERATVIVLRTGIHPGLDDLLSDRRVSTCDDIYATAATFDDVYSSIVDRVIAESRRGDLVYATPGHPLIGERTVTQLFERAAELGIALELVPGISSLDAIALTLRIDLMADEVQLIDAAELQAFVSRDPFNGGIPELSPRRPILIGQVYSQSVASIVKLALSRLFPDEHPVAVVTSAGVPGEEGIARIHLFELDRIDVNHLTSVYLEPLGELEATQWPLTLNRIAARLRAPEGCPWDREQSHLSLRRTVIEEAYEVVDAIDEGDPVHLSEELGDLLLNVYMHAQIAEETGEFSIGDVFDHVNRKLVRRHPHVFGDVVAGTPDAVVQTWDAVKAKERGDRPLDDQFDPFDRLPKSMPTFDRIIKLSRNRSGETFPATATGEDLLNVIESLSRSGYDPERELERAYRARTTKQIPVNNSHEGERST